MTVLSVPRWFLSISILYSLSSIMRCREHTTNTQTDGFSDATAMRVFGRRGAFLFALSLIVPFCFSFVELLPHRTATSCTLRGVRSLAPPCFLTASGKDADDDVGPNNDQDSPVSAFESMVRKVTGKSDYKFGDFTKKAVSTTTNAVEELAKKTNIVDDDYHFGVSNEMQLFDHYQQYLKHSSTTGYYQRCHFIIIQACQYCLVGSRTNVVHSKRGQYTRACRFIQRCLDGQSQRQATTRNMDNIYSPCCNCGTCL